MPLQVTAGESFVDWRVFLPVMVVRNDRTGELIRIKGLIVEVERAVGSQPEAEIEPGDQLLSVAWESCQ